MLKVRYELVVEGYVINGENEVISFTDKNTYGDAVAAGNAIYGYLNDAVSHDAVIRRIETWVDYENGVVMGHALPIASCHIETRRDRVQVIDLDFMAAKKELLKKAEARRCN